MAKQVWTFEGIGEHRCCTLCPKPAAYLGDNDNLYDVVWLCTDCADALADVVNERRAAEKDRQVRIRAGRAMLRKEG